MTHLAVRVGDRTITRLAEDLTFSRSLHGDAALGLRLREPIIRQQFAPFEKAWVYDAGANIQWHGRTEDPGRSVDGDGQVWALTAVGEPARASDRTIAVIYVDRELDGFNKTAGSATSAAADVSTLPSNEDTDALVMQFNPGQPIDDSSVSAMAYKKLANIGQLLGGFSYQIVAGANTVNFEQQATARTLGVVGVSTVRQHAFSTTAFNVAPASAGSSFTVGANVLTLRIARVSGGATTIGSDIFYGGFYDVWVRGLLLDKNGNQISGPNTYANAYVLAHEVVQDLLGRGVLPYDVATASIDTSATHQFNQLAFVDGATAAQILDALVELLPEFYWQVGPPNASGKPTFVWRKWPTTVRYEFSMGDGLDLPGNDAERFNEVVVRWRDDRGRIKVNTYAAGTTIGGTVVPAVAALDAQGLTRTGYVDLADEVGSQANADKAAAEFLLEHGTPPTAATLTVARKVWDNDLGRLVEPYEIMPGHLGRIRELADSHTDLTAADRDGKSVFRVMGMEYSRASHSARVELDAPPKTDVATLAAVVSNRERRR